MASPTNFNYPSVPPPLPHHPITPPPPHVHPPPPPHVHPPPPPTPPSPSPDSDTTVIVIVFVSFGSLFFLAFLAAALCCYVNMKKKKKKRKTVQETDVVHVDEHLKVKEAIADGPHGPKAVVLDIEDDVHVDEEIRNCKETFGESAKSNPGAVLEEGASSSGSNHHHHHHQQYQQLEQKS